MRARGVIILAAFGPSALVVACATERPVRSAPRTSAASHADIASGADVAAVPPPPADEGALTARYSSRRALSVQQGQASYYGNSLAGHKTASGERYDPHAFTAAHRTLALGTVARVRRSDTGAVVYVRITDRGPFGSSHRIIDLSHAAAERLGMIRAGVAEIRLEVVEYGQGLKPRHRR
ncbi:MAG TPA: septal ring lytic transglycosylase RlpA family protein [Polyangiaceae bacterium]|jgi:rare lipoprotein A|nr:septal ring lytic transglycosylase RlpA family protein [Polyangiaceae bacterium]